MPSDTQAEAMISAESMDFSLRTSFYFPPQGTYKVFVNVWKWTQKNESSLYALIVLELM